MSQLKILLCHNAYRQRGGEDTVFEEEGRLLEANGHEVIRYQRSNDEVPEFGKAGLFRKLIWNRESERAVSNLIEKERPDILHCHNTFPIISPSVYSAAKKKNVTVIQSLHNYRLICPNAMQLRDGSRCTDCSGKQFAWPAVLHSCYRGSKAASAAVASMLAYHHSIGTWRNNVDRYIALSEHMKKTLVAGGLSPDKIRVKPNFVGRDTKPGNGKGGYAVYLGRISEEKGIDVLLDAWKALETGLELRVLGDGPCLGNIRKYSKIDPRVRVLGSVDADTVYQTLGDAAFLVVPSIWPEPFGLNVIEAFAKGTPVIASQTGTLPELVEDGQNGALFEVGNAQALSQAISRMVENPAKLQKLRRGARKSFEAHFTAERNYTLLMSIYNETQQRDSSMQ